MGYYKVNFGDYCLAHHDNFKYFNYFEFKGKKYPIGAYVNLTKEGEYYILHDQGYNFIRGNFRLVDHFVNDKGVEYWKYIVGKLYDCNTPIIKHTTKTPDELVGEVKCLPISEDVFTPGELKVEFKEPNCFPKDWEVDGVMIGWAVMAVAWIAALALKDWWLRLVIQISVSWYFGSWREKKMNEAIVNQKFKK